MRFLCNENLYNVGPITQNYDVVVNGFYNIRGHIWVDSASGTNQPHQTAGGGDRGAVIVDMDGDTWHYEIAASEILQPTQIEEMTTKTANDDWDLTLFTCTTGGQARHAVRCVRTDKDES